MAHRCTHSNHCSALNYVMTHVYVLICYNICMYKHILHMYRHTHTCTNTYRIAQNVGRVKLWRNHSTRVIGRLNFGELSRFSIAFQCINNIGWENFGQSMDNCQIRQCFPPQTFYAIRHYTYTFYIRTHTHTTGTYIHTRIQINTTLFQVCLHITNKIGTSTFISCYQEVSRMRTHTHI